MNCLCIARLGRLVRFALLASVLWQPGGTAWGAIVVIPPPAAPPAGYPFHRFVVASATDAPSGTPVAAADSDDTFGHFGPPPDGVVGIVGTGFDGSSLAAGATQDSTTPDAVGPSIYGVGTATASVTASMGGEYSVTADSFFDVFFKVDVEATYHLGGFVDAGGIAPPGGFPPGSGGIFAYVTLENFTSSTELYSKDFDPLAPGPDPLGFSALLSPDIVYRLTAEAGIGRGGVPGSYADFAIWDFRLDPQPVPEPSSLVLMAGLALLLPVIRHRRRLGKKGTFKS